MRPMLIFSAFTSMPGACTICAALVAGASAAATADDDRLGTGILEPPGDKTAPSLDEDICAAAAAAEEEEEEEDDDDEGAAAAEGFAFTAWVKSNFLRDGMLEAATDAQSGDSAGMGGIRRLK